MSTEKLVIVSGGFDDIRSRHLRFLEEAAKLGLVTVLLWSDELLQHVTGKPPKFPFAERHYFLSGLRHVSKVLSSPKSMSPCELPPFDFAHPQVWIDEEVNENEARRAECQRKGVEYRVLPALQMNGFPASPPAEAAPNRKKILVTGCYDWFHSGHVRFMEEVSAYGDLYVIVGHDANIRLLKGEGRPLFPEAERRYVVGSIRFVKQALISSGNGWIDADPEIRKLKPDIYAVNEDGDQGGKREYCRELGIEYLVLKRRPAAGLTPRSSTDLRGF